MAAPLPDNHTLPESHQVQAITVAPAPSTLTQFQLFPQLPSEI
jgi:hypothetical protein